MPNIVGSAAAGFQDASLWEEAKKKSDDAGKRLSDKGLEGTTVTVVCIGAKTAGRKFINYEIEKSISRGNGLVGVQIHHLKDKDGSVDLAGATPTGLNAYKVYKYTDKESLAKWIEQAARDAGK